MILEVAVLNLMPGRSAEFEAAFSEASSVIAASPGYISHELQVCVETPDRYLLLVRWESNGGPHPGLSRLARLRTLESPPAPLL
jgi:heme-degrading monooxygenase HmoA